ncbi:MAG: hypothetical protein ACRDT4_14520 [Micromonosporaceae bacterium]
MHPLLTLELGRIRSQELLAEAAASRRWAQELPPRQHTGLSLTWLPWRHPAAVTTPQCTG